MIELQSLTKRYGDRTAVDDLSFTAEPGTVTGFLGPNGAGKSTSMRMVLGLDRPTSGQALVNGKRYVDGPAPLHEVGALLEAKAVHPGRTARNHLLALGATHGIGATRVDEVLGIVGLTDVAGKRVKGFSLGMGQRLGIAVALLGDPGVLLLDEPINGLDPEGIRWVRELLRHLAGEGRTVLLSSHVMSEMAQTAEDIVIIGRGKLIASTTVAELVEGAGGGQVSVRSGRSTALASALKKAGGTVAKGEQGQLLVSGLPVEQVGQVAFDAGVVLHELTMVQGSLEDVFMQMTADSVEYGRAQGSAA